jgi:hypothetical protein
MGSICEPLFILLIKEKVGCAMAQVVSLWPLIVEAWIHALVIPCRICGGKSGTKTVFLSAVRFSHQYHSTVPLHSYISSERMNNRPSDGHSSET